MNFTQILFTPTSITKGLDVIRQMKSLTVMSVGDARLPPAEFWKKYDAGEFGKPDPKGKGKAGSSPISTPPSSSGSQKRKPCLPRSRSKPSARS